LLVLVLGGLALPYLFSPPLFSLAIESADEAVNVATYAVVGLGLGLLISWLQTARRELEANHQRRETMLRIAHRLAVQAGDRLMLLRAVAEETAALCAQTAVTVYQWDPSRELLVPVAASQRASDVESTPLRLGEGIHGRAAATRSTCVINSYQEVIGPTTPLGKSGVHAGIAVPLQYEGRLLGTLAVGALTPAVRFSDVDAEVLELLASTAAAIFIGLERAQLEGVLLTARTVQHELNDQLAQVVGYADLLAGDPRLSAELEPLGHEVVEGAQRAAATVERLQYVSDVQTVERGGPGPILHLVRSTKRRAAERRSSAG
jgi:K+-sensing histidine kinase KdpD